MCFNPYLCFMLQSPLFLKTLVSQMVCAALHPFRTGSIGSRLSAGICYPELSFWQFGMS